MIKHCKFSSSLKTGQKKFKFVYITGFIIKMIIRIMMCNMIIREVMYCSGRVLIKKFDKHSNYLFFRHKCRYLRNIY